MKSQAQWKVPKWEDMSIKDKIQGVLGAVFLLIVAAFILILVAGAFVGSSQTPQSPSVAAQSEPLAAQLEPAPPPIFREITDIKEARYLAERTLQVMESAYPSLVDAITLQDARGKYDFVDKPLNEIIDLWPTMIEPKGETVHFEYCGWAARQLQSVSIGSIGKQTTGKLKFMRESEARYLDGLEKCKQALSLSDRELRALQ